MKLKKSWLIKTTKDKLLKFGYQEINDTVTGASGLFIKKFDEIFYLSLGFTISNNFDSRFTASFYLSKTTRWGSVWGDIPKESYQRIGRFLSQAEREIYLTKEQSKEGMLDSWWSDDDINIDNFIKVIELTEKRFLQQEGLIPKIESSIEIKELVEEVRNVNQVLGNGLQINFDYQYIPKENVDNIPIEWFKASEQVLNERGGILNSKTVILLAADAWRQSQLNRSIRNQNDVKDNK